MILVDIVRGVQTSTWRKVSEKKHLKRSVGSCYMKRLKFPRGKTRLTKLFALSRTFRSLDTANTLVINISVPGITQKLDYLKDLGVDVIWVSPSSYTTSQRKDPHTLNKVKYTKVHKQTWDTILRITKTSILVTEH